MLARPCGRREEKMKEFTIGLSSWIIQDGNYGDFAVGDDTQFALEFYSEEIKKSDDQKIKMERIEDAQYIVNGLVVFLDEEFLVIDVGILIYWQYSKRKFGFKKGDYITGNVWIGIDPFFYFESGYKNKGIPELIYNWKIRDIKIETAPFIDKTDDAGRVIRIRDENKLNKVSIQKTDAWKDDNGYGDYIFICELLNGKPKRRFG